MVSLLIAGDLTTAHNCVTSPGDASYLEEYRIDVSKLEPLVAAPHSPDNRKTAHECSSTKIDRVYIGCVPFLAARHRMCCPDSHNGIFTWCCYLISVVACE